MTRGANAPDFSRRADTAELMDLEPSSYDDYRACLRNLARVNGLTLAYRPTLAFLGRLASRGRLRKDRPVAIVDVGCGYGDMLRRIDRWAMRRGIAVALTGVDLNPRSVRAAAEATPPGRPIRWVDSDFSDVRATIDADVIVSSLFAHHLDDADVIRFLAWMEATARIGWFVNDLHRHPVPYHGFRIWAGLARWHRFVQHDGPVSIARAFVRSDWSRLLAAAAIPTGAARVEWWMPFRLCVARVREP